MVDESIHNKPRDPAEERFARLEEKVADISRNMSLLVAVLTRNIGLFREFGGLNLQIGLDRKWGDNKDPEKELRKKPEKDQSSCSTINPSQYLFKIEDKVDINSYQGDINALERNLLRIVVKH
jgi:hypothetical protein